MHLRHFEHGTLEEFPYSFLSLPIRLPGTDERVCACVSGMDGCAKEPSSNIVGFDTFRLSVMFVINGGI